MLKLLTGNSSNVVEIVRFRDGTTGSMISGATVRCMGVRPIGGSNLAGESFPVDMVEVAAGRYRCVLDPALAVVEGTIYEVVVLAQISGKEREFVELALAEAA